LPFIFAFWERVDIGYRECYFRNGEKGFAHRLWLGIKGNMVQRKEANMLRPIWLFPVVEEIKGEHDPLETRSYQALRNMLGYCQARVVQLMAQRQHLDFQSRQQHDLYELLETWQRLERVQYNFRRFSEQCLLIKLEMARRKDSSPRDTG
jgi:hypothetical protein